MNQHTAWLLLGTNLGNRADNLLRATMAIRMFVGRVDKQSHIYETEPWGKAHQPAFYNQAISVITPCTALETLQMIKQVEFFMGRETSEKWSPRIIDIDILFYDDLQIESNILTVPHPHLHDRRFTLAPLKEIAPDLIHPLLQKSITELYDECNDALKVEALDLVWQL